MNVFDGAREFLTPSCLHRSRMSRPRMTNTPSMKIYITLYQLCDSHYTEGECEYASYHTEMQRSSGLERYRKAMYIRVARSCAASRATIRYRFVTCF